MTYRILMKCENGHEDRLTLIGMDRSYAESLAGLIDGTSEHYIHKPREVAPDTSQIGKCPKCGAWFNSTVEEVLPGCKEHNEFTNSCQPCQEAIQSHSKFMEKRYGRRTKTDSK